MGYARVIVGTDGSRTAEAAVRAAAELAAGHGAELVVATALGSPRDEPGAALARDEAEEIGRRGDALAREAGAASVVVRAGDGAPADVLLDAAAELRADLIVVGSRGMTRPSRTGLGAVANTVSHHATCDVLVFHTES